MLPYIDNAQADKLRQTLFIVMENYEIAEAPFTLRTSQRTKI